MTDKDTIARLESELLAERQRREQAEADAVKWCSRFEEESANAYGFNQRLLSALAAIEKHNEDQRRNMLPDFIDDELDLSLLRQHDADLRAQWDKEHEEKAKKS